MRRLESACPFRSLVTLVPWSNVAGRIFSIQQERNCQSQQQFPSPMRTPYAAIVDREEGVWAASSSSHVGHLATMTTGSSGQHREIAFLRQERLFVFISVRLDSLEICRQLYAVQSSHWKFQ